MRGLLAGLVAILVLGCKYKPEHINNLAAARDHFDWLIHRIEEDHGLDHTRGLNWKVREMENEIAALRRELDPAVRAKRAEEDRQYAEWLGSLTDAQRFQWMLLQEKAEHQREMAEVHRAEAEKDRRFAAKVVSQQAEAARRERAFRSIAEGMDDVGSGIVEAAEAGTWSRSPRRESPTVYYPPTAISPRWTPSSPPVRPQRMFGDTPNQYRARPDPTSPYDGSFIIEER